MKQAPPYFASAALITAALLLLPARGAAQPEGTVSDTRPGAVTVGPGRPALVAPAKDVEPVSMIFTAGEREDRFLLARGQLGLVSHSGVTLVEVSRFAGSLGLEVAATVADSFVIVEIGESLSHQELLRRADEIASQTVDEFDRRAFRAGLVFYREETGVPFVGFEEILVQFRGEPVAEQLADAVGGRLFATRKVSPALPGLYLLSSSSAGASDLFDFLRQLNERADVEFAHLDGVAASEDRQVTPNDALFGNQWHHANTGQGAGTPDADVDTDWAWTLTQGVAGTLIAVTDNGFDVNHPDYQNNLWVNPGEVPGDGLDNDGNGWADDVNGFNFGACNVAGPPFCNGAITAQNHGTAVAGVVAAQSNNTIGVAGACPQCTIALVQRGNTFGANAAAIAYAQQINAAISTNSWGYTNPPAVVTNAINNTAAAGVSIFFAMANGNQDDCLANDISANANVIAVSALSNQDRKVTESAFGNCMEISAPTHRGYGGGTPFTGTLNVATTDRVGAAGYNNSTAPAAPCPGETAGSNNYTLCFGGTSAATPLTAGVAGLMLSANNALTVLQLRRALLDTADKPQDSTAGYREVDGFSRPGGGASTHGYGRVNAFEAVRLVAPVALGGRGNVDAFLRDNRLDWGNTERPSNVLMEPTRGFIPHYRSVDIRVDAPPFAAAAPTTQALFEAFASEDPVAEAVNKVYVRVRNRGQTAATSVRVKLHWTFAGTALPALPADFWTRFPDDSLDAANPWTTIDPQPPLATLAYSGSSVAGSAADAAAILEFDWTTPALDPAAAHFRHHCLLAVVDAANDPVNETGLVPDLVTPTNNNVTHRNVSLQDPMTGGRAFPSGLLLRNPFSTAIRTRLTAIAPGGWQIDLAGFGRERLLGPGEEVAVESSFTGRGDGRVMVVQEYFDPGRGDFVALGGFDYVFGDPEGTATTPSTGSEAGPGALPAGASYPAPFAISLRAGAALPHISALSSGVSANLGVEYAVAANLTVEAILGYHTLDSASGADLDIAQLSINLRRFLSGTGRLTPFVNGGVGAYDLDPGDARFGANAGAGLDYALSGGWFLEGAYNYHWIDGPAPELSSVQVGLRYRF